MKSSRALHAVCVAGCPTGPTTASPNFTKGIFLVEFSTYFSSRIVPSKGGARWGSGGTEKLRPFSSRQRPFLILSYDFHLSVILIMICLSVKLLVFTFTGTGTKIFSLIEHVTDVFLIKHLRLRRSHLIG